MKILPYIVQSLTQKALHNLPAQHRLEGGLWLTLEVSNPLYQLSLTRKDVRPSPTEEQVCRRAFGVPTDAVRSIDSFNEYLIVRFRWLPGRGRLTREIGQGHLAPRGYGHFRDVLDKWNAREINDWGKFSTEQLQKIHYEIYGGKQNE